MGPTGATDCVPALLRFDFTFTSPLLHNDFAITSSRHFPLVHADTDGFDQALLTQLHQRRQCCRDRLVFQVLPVRIVKIDHVNMPELMALQAFVKGS